jgi:hypothetical protein
MAMGPARFPIPDDPDPVRKALRGHEERRDRLSILLEDAGILRTLIAQTDESRESGGME